MKLGEQKMSVAQLYDLQQRLRERGGAKAVSVSSWTPERDAILREEYGKGRGYGIRIAERFGIAPSTVTSRAHALGLTQPRVRRKPEERKPMPEQCAGCVNREPQEASGCVAYEDPCREWRDGRECLGRRMKARWVE